MRLLILTVLATVCSKQGSATVSSHSGGSATATTHGITVATGTTETSTVRSATAAATAATSAQLTAGSEIGTERVGRDGETGTPAHSQTGRRGDGTPDALQHTSYRGERGGSAGVPHGFGRMEWVTGEAYEGFFLHGVPHGDGRLRDPDGRTVEGRWANGALEALSPSTGTARPAKASSARGAWDAEAAPRADAETDGAGLGGAGPRDSDRTAAQAADGQHFIDTAAFSEPAQFGLSARGGTVFIFVAGSEKGEKYFPNPPELGGGTAPGWVAMSGLTASESQLLLAGNGETVVRLRYRAAVHPPVSLAPPAAVVRTVGAVGAVDGVAAEATAIAADLLEYSGGIVNGRWQGIGEIVLLREASPWRRFTGAWWAGEMQGEGILEWRDGSRYDGGWTGGKRHGTGTMRYPVGHHKNRLMYTGGWDRNNRAGQGVLTWRDGGRYEGAWTSDHRDGIGTYCWPDGKIFVGGWRRGKREGLGMMSALDTPPVYDVYESNVATRYIEMRCAAGTISQMKELVATLARVPVGHRAAEIDRCEGYALGFLWSNENVLHALRGHTMRDEL